ncbi:MAG: hypothetical protein KJ677_08950 [Gammaproteobacteria bacterium]|nr:hypothetical protein [Gammaproteobacteria bacterium]MBV1731305.1 hypothetical protein [Hydrogenophaga sp.]
MDEADAFFTQTIVGAPFTVLLGRRIQPVAGESQGLEINPTTGESRLTRVWQDWIVLSHACDPVGQSRSRPGRLRRQLERHALWIGVLGLLSLAGSLVFWGVTPWS